MADCFAGRAQACTSRCFGTRDEATIRGEVLHPWEALNVMDVVEQHEAEDFANTGHRLPQVKRRGIVLRGGLEEERFRRGLHIAVQQHCPRLAQDADVHRTGMQVDPTIHWVLIGVKSPEVSSSLVSGFSQ